MHGRMASTHDATGDLLALAPLPPKPAQLVRLGLIGLGWVTRACHLPAIRFLQERGWPVAITSVCDRDQGAIAATRDAHPDAREFAEARAMLAAGGWDGCLIAVWPPASGELARAVMEQRIPALVEKPVLNDPAGLRALEQLGLQLGAAVHVAYNRRWQPLAKPLYEAARDQHPDFVRVVLYRNDRDESGFYPDVLVHPLDFVRSVAGELTFEAGEWAKPGAGRRLPAGALLRLRTAQGAPVHVEVRPAVGRPRESYELVFGDGTWELGYLVMINNRPCDPARVVCWRRGEPRLFGEVGSGAEPEAQLVVRGFVHQMAGFIHAAATGVPSTSVAASLMDARRAMELCHEAGALH